MTSKKQIIIIGTGETAALAYEYFTADSDFQVAGFAVEKKFYNQKNFCGLPVCCFEDVEKCYDPEKFSAFVALGSGELNRQRTRLYHLTKAKGYSLVSYISSHAFVWHNVVIGDNCFIMEQNVLQPFTKVGNNVIMWSGNHLGHRSQIGDNCFVSSHVVISGFCQIGENCFIGVNTSIGDGISVGEDNFIAMGTVITKNTAPNSIMRGNPAAAHKISAKKFCQVEE